MDPRGSARRDDARARCSYDEAHAKEATCAECKTRDGAMNPVCVMRVLCAECAHITSFRPFRSISFSSQLLDECAPHKRGAKRGARATARCAQEAREDESAQRGDMRYAQMRRGAAQRAR